MIHKTLTKLTVDHSTGNGFSFSFFCDICGKEWTSPVKPFSGGSCSIVENEEAMNLLWSDEHRTAFNEANLEAHFHFKKCPKCGRWVCDNCFSFEEGKTYYSCKECNGK